MTTSEVRRTHWVFALAALFLAVGCDRRTHLDFDDANVHVRVVSDYVPGVDARRVEVDVLSIDNRVLARSGRDVVRETPLADGVEVGTFDSLPPNEYLFRAVLRHSDGHIVAKNWLRARVELGGTYTVAILTACDGVVCADSMACLNGECVNPGCSADAPNECPSPTTLCDADDDCESEVSCATATCEAGFCIARQRPEACDESEYCSHDEGCVPVEPPAPPDPSPSNDPLCNGICRLEEAPCWYGYYRCEMTSAGELTRTCTLFTTRPEGAPCGDGRVCSTAFECVEAPDSGSFDASTFDASTFDAGDDMSITDASADTNVANDMSDSDAGGEDGGAACVPTSEVCNGRDDDCDGLVDNGFALTAYYRDFDGDSYGSGGPNMFCAARPGYVTTAGDCDDGEVLANPGEVEICDGIDNDCDASVDEELRISRYLDVDGDGYGGTFLGDYCPGVGPGVATPGDCDDMRLTIFPGSYEACDGIDNDCDLQIDEDFALVAGYVDADRDGYGTGTAVYVCVGTPGYAATAGDCDDNDPIRKPGLVEICDGVDNDCDLQVDEGFALTNRYADEDGDGYGGALIGVLCAVSGPGVTAAGDCDDTNPAVRPGAFEACDDLDNDCDGSVDENYTGTNVVINTASDYALYKYCRYLGSVTAGETSTVLDLTFPNLREMNGDLTVTGGAATTTVSMPKLTKLWSIYINNGSLQSIALPMLPQVGNLQLTAPALTSQMFSALTTITGQLRLANTPLTSFTLPALVISQSPMELRGNALLRTVSFPALIGVNALNGYSGTSIIEGSPLLESFSAPSVVSWRQAIRFDATLVAPLDHLHTIELPKLKETYDLYLRNLPSLSNIDFSALEHTLDTIWFVSLPLIADITFPKLLSTTGGAAHMLITDMPNLVTFTADRLQSVGYALRFLDCPKLESLSLDALTFAGYDIVVARTAITDFTLPNLEKVRNGQNYGGLRLVDNADLRSISLPQVTQISAAAYPSDGPLVSGSPRLQEVSAPNLVESGNSLFFENLPELVTLELTSLKKAYELKFVSLPSLTNFELSALENPYAGLRLEALALSDLPFSGTLKTTGNTTALVNLPALVDVEFPALDSGGGWAGLVITDCSHLRRISLPIATDIVGAGLLQNLPALEELSAPHLRRWGATLNFVGSLAFPQHLETVDLPELIEAGSMIFENVPTLTSLSLASLQTIGHFSIVNVGATTVSLPALTTQSGWFLVQNNSALTSVDLGSLRQSTYFVLTGNPLLATVTVPTSPRATVVNANCSGMPLLCNVPLFDGPGSCATYDPC